MNFESQLISYGDLKKGIKVENDKFEIAYYEYECRRKTFLSNPYIPNDEETYMYLSLADGVPVGRTTLYKTRLKKGIDILPMSTGSALKVEDSYQKYGLGGEIFYYGYSLKNQKYLLAAGISPLALPLYKKLKYNIFEYPKFLLLKRTAPIYQKLGLKGFLLSLFSTITNGCLSVTRIYGSAQLRKYAKRYQIKRQEVIPDWVEEMILQDPHKYSEFHGKAWLQWNLDNNFKGDIRDIQRFYGVYQKERPIGFFMTKERFRPSTQGLKNVLVGSIVEWQSAVDSLDEYQLTLLALSTFSKDLNIIETATTDTATAKKLKACGFIHKGDAHIAFKDKSKELKDAGEQSLWRIRYGYADVILT